MLRIFAMASLAVAAFVMIASPVQADVFVRAPFVRVYVGAGGVNVRAPFVGVSSPGPGLPGPAPLLVPQQAGPQLPPPMALPGDPLPSEVIRPMTLSEFAHGFKGGCGNYEVVLINPCTCQPCLVRFCLPDCPRRVTCGRDEVVFHYGLLKKVRIHFDNGGPTVVARGI